MMYVERLIFIKNFWFENDYFHLLIDGPGVATSVGGIVDLKVNDITSNLFKMNAR